MTNHIGLWNLNFHVLINNYHYYYTKFVSSKFCMYVVVSENEFNNYAIRY